MKEVVIRKFVLILFMCFALSNCVNNDYETPENIEVHDFIWKGFNAYYLDQENIPDLSDNRFNSDQQLESYLKGFGTPEDIFNSILSSTDLRSKLIEDHTLIETPIPKRSSFTNGVEFGVFMDPNISDNLIGYVSHILPYSYASTQDISRGEFFYAIINEENDVIPLVEENYMDMLVNYEQDTLKLLMADYDGNTLVTNNKRIDLVKESYEYPPIFIKKVMDVSSKKVGYLMYNNDFSNNYIEDLNATMLEFKNQSIDDLVIDLRFNIGQNSFAKTITEIASMITGQFTDEILIKENWNLKAQPWFELNQPDSLISRFTSYLDNNQLINSLNMTDVYIILNGNGFNGSSAIELLINSLQPYINVHVIGNSTKGDNVGSITLYDSPDYDFFARNSNHLYALQPKVLTFTNLNNESYENGISPNIPLCSDEDPLNLGELGETSDPILNRVLNYISSGNVGINPTCNPLNLKLLYNSINSQRGIDAGIFIKQDLPNLGR
ncbi:MAG: Uncharacterised protein [Flavobacterium sp. SCGC AAA160-P02]|nr:MAG: Uncharacterised protein [Flavobacterium sp. SCGC AAA160-P02]